MKSKPAAPLSKTVRAEAAAWVARLHGSGRTRSLEAGLREWLQADPEHARAFEIATEAWEIGGSVPAAAVQRITNPVQQPVSKRSFKAPALAVGAALGALAIGTLFHVFGPDSAVTTRVGEQRMLTLNDGTRIFLNTGTRLFVQENETERRVRLEDGEALFDVTPDPNRPFVVTVDRREVVALGTSFVVRRDEQQLSVTLMEGKVAVSPMDKSRADADGGAMPHSSEASATVDAVLVPGQRLTFVSGEPPKLDEPAIENVTAWRRGEVILDNTLLPDAVEELNRYSAVKLVIVDSTTASIRVSGIFRVGDSARFAQAIAATHHLAVEHQPRRILLSNSSN